MKIPLMQMSVTELYSYRYIYVDNTKDGCGYTKDVLEYLPRWMQTTCWHNVFRVLPLTHHLCQLFLPDWEVSIAYPDPWCGISLLDWRGCNWQRAAFFRVLDIKSHTNLFSRGWYAAGIALSELLRFFISPEERKQPDLCPTYHWVTYVDINIIANQNLA